MMYPGVAHFHVVDHIVAAADLCFLSGGMVTLYGRYTGGAVSVKNKIKYVWRREVWKGNFKQVYRWLWLFLFNVA